MICEEVANKAPKFTPKAVPPTPRIPCRASMYASLERAKRILAAQLMTPEDVTAWLDLNELQEQLLRQV